MYVCFACIHEYEPCTHLVPEDVKRGYLNPELELGMLMSLQVGAENRTCVLERAASALNL